ncbi:MAG: NAD+ synthase [Fimbriimonadaceae bacterium]|nr:NAD+ synthase [Fimbriimonadaceae bacterium]
MSDRLEQLWADEAVPTELRINAAVVERMLVGFLADEIRKVGFGRAVIGLSGGIDSAVSLYLAARALGANQVHAVLMPYRTSSQASLDDAMACVEDLGTPYAVVDISPQIDAYYAQPVVPVDPQIDQDRLRRGNKMARERMTILYDFSQHLGALVVGTSNKSELLLGYGTLHGDMAHALNPIGDLYKTQVRQLAAHLGVPEPVLVKPPTADLYEGQTDEDQIGYSYAAIDSVFIHLVERRLPPEKVIALGFEEHFVQRVMRMVQRSQFKRRLPVIAKVSERTIDRDFRYSRDWCY